MDNDSINMTETDMPTPHEQLECRRTFVRRNVPCPDVDEAWQRFADRNGVAPRQETGEGRPVARHLRLWWAAACVVGLMLLSAVVWKQHADSRLQVCQATEERQGITVSGDDGSERTLTAVHDIRFTRPHRQVKTIGNVTVKTSRGKDCHLTLPDGTEVWLDAESSLQFPETFSGRTRDVQLSGRAYFDVKHDRSHPFIVTSARMQTIVYGTAFNMDVREASSASVTLVRGRVAVRERVDDKNLSVLSPGQQAVAGEGGLTVREVDPYPYVQWREGFFYFDNERLADIMRQLGEWYDVNVVFDDVALMDRRFHFAADRNASLDEVVASINKMMSVTVSVKDNTVTVSEMTE